MPQHEENGSNHLENFMRSVYISSQTIPVFFFILLSYTTPWLNHLHKKQVINGKCNKFHAHQFIDIKNLQSLLITAQCLHTLALLRYHYSKILARRNIYLTDGEIWLLCLHYRSKFDSDEGKSAI